MNNTPGSQAMLRHISHVIYYVSALGPSIEYYCGLLGFHKVDSLGPGAAFLALPGSPNYFDLGLIEVGDEAQLTDGNCRRGVYHVGWAVATPEHFWHLYRCLEDRDLVIGASDHQTHVSLYSLDPDGNEVEITWQRHSSRWRVGDMVVRPLAVDENFVIHEGAAEKQSRLRKD
jgi:catechol 2,3-dioxygenase